jgi:hypothetical protein
MTFDTWNVRSLYRTGSLMIVVREISKYMIDLVEVKEVRWARVGKYAFFYGKGMRIMN